MSGIRCDRTTGHDAPDKARPVLTRTAMIRSSAIPILLLAASACGTSAPDDGEICEAGHCDGLPFAEQLKGRQDPIAQFLRGLES